MLIGSGFSHAGGAASAKRRASKWMRGRSDIVPTAVFTPANVCESEGETSRLAGAKWRSPGAEPISPDETGVAEVPGDQVRNMYRANNNQRVLTRWEAATRLVESPTRSKVEKVFETLWQGNGPRWAP